MPAKDSYVIRAIYDETTIRVYQAYRPEIAEAALEAGRFIPPFKMDRMTWIKPSFNWMMYRSGYGRKEGQEYVLGIDITREGFEWALANSARSTFTARLHDSYEAWQEEVKRQSVRIQWDPEKNWRLNPIAGVRSIQIGLTGEAVRRFVSEWTVRIEDITPLAHQAEAAAQAKAESPDLPWQHERPYPVPEHLMGVCG